MSQCVCMGTMADILTIVLHVLGLKFPKFPEIHESQENQVSCDSMKESQAQMEGIE